MRIGGVDNSHSASDHHVTDCMHEHVTISKKAGGASAGASASSNRAAAGNASLRQGQFSLKLWLKNMLGNGRNLLKRFWGSEEAGKTDVSKGTFSDAASAAGKESGVHSGPASSLAEDMSVISSASAAVPPQTAVKNIHNNPYFSAIEDTGEKGRTLWQKVRVRFHNISGQLSGRLPGKSFGFQAKNSFQAKREKPGQDLRKRSRYRENDMEIDCVLTDDSYLMDSYDRKGEYTTLTVTDQPSAKQLR